MISHFWKFIMSFFLLIPRFIYNVQPIWSVFVCVYVHLLDDAEPASLYIFLNCVLHMWFLALRLTRQEHSAPTLGDMIEKVLPGK